MQENFSLQIQQDQQQKRKQLFLQFLFSKMTNSELQRNIYSNSLQNIYQAIKKLLIKKSFDQQIQEKEFKIRNKIKCPYNQLILCEFFCCQLDCKKFAAICGQSNCQCQKNHQNCKIIAVNTIIQRIEQKLKRIPPKSYLQYIQGKSYLINFMIETISLERSIFQDWVEILKQQKQEARQHLYLFGFTDIGRSSCTNLKVGIGRQGIKEHEPICFPIKLNMLNYKNPEHVVIINRISKSYQTIIDYLQRQIEDIQTIESISYYLNFAEQQIFKHFIEGDLMKNCQHYSKLTGSIIFQANSLKNFKKGQYFKKQQLANNNKLFITTKFGFENNVILQFKQFQNLSLQHSIEYLRRQWKTKCQRIFHRFIQGAVLRIPSLLPKQRCLNKANICSLDDNLPFVFEQIFKMRHLLSNIDEYNNKTVRNYTFNYSQFNQEILNYCTKINLTNQDQFFQNQTSLTKKIVGKFKKLKYLNQLYFENKTDPQLLQFQAQKQLYLKKSTNQMNIISLIQHQFFRQAHQKINYIKVGGLDKPNFLFQENQKIKQKKIKNVFINLQKFSNLSDFIYRVKNLKRLAVSLSLYLQKDKKNHQNYLQQQVNKLIKINKNLQILQTCGKFSLIQVIKQNKPRLNKIIFHKNYVKENFFLMKQLKNLTYLDLTGCTQGDKNSFQISLSNLSVLKYLILKGCNWTDNIILSSIGKNCLNLQLLNISQIKYIDNLSCLNLLKDLKCLNCAYTSTRGNAIVSLSNYCHNLTNLCFEGLKGQDGYGQISIEQLFQIDRNCQKGITCLNIVDCMKIYQKELNLLSQLKNLKHLKIKNIVPQKENFHKQILFLRRQGIIVKIQE